MKINPISDNNQSFLFKPLKIIQSLGWVAVLILALPTVIGSYFAWKKLAAIWNKNERPDTEKTDKIASEVLLKDFVDIISDEDYVAKTPQQEKEALYGAAIEQFKESGCLRSCSAEAYLDYLKNTESNLGFHFNTSLLYSSGIKLNEFLTNIQKEITEVPSLAFVPFLLAGNLFREQHIVVAVINLRNEQIEYFDPKGNQFYSIFGSLVDCNLARWGIPAQKFLEDLSASIFPYKKSPSIIRNINGPQSLFNKVDCGAHVLDFVQVRMHTDFIQSDKYPNYFETSLSSDGKQLREEMAATLQAKLN